MENVYFNIIDSYVKEIVIKPIFEERLKDVFVLLGNKQILDTDFVFIFRIDDCFQIFFKSQGDNLIKNRGIVIARNYITENYFSAMLVGNHLEWHKNNINSIYNNYFKGQSLPDVIKTIVINGQSDQVGVLYYCSNGNNSGCSLHEKLIENILSMVVASGL